MRSFAFAAIAAAASAGRVHDFFAENNYICELCKTAVDYASKGRDIELDRLYEQFPKLQDRINFFANQAELVNLTKPEETCKKIDLCSSDDILELLHEEKPLDLSAHIETVNSNPSSTWVAGVNNKFEGASLKEIKSLMGTIVDPDWTITLRPRDSPMLTADDLPESFDSREAWPECESVINHVRDQSNCGSCWAHGTTEALNDRICISTGGNFTTLLSVADTTACCNFLQCQSMGCNGGQVGSPWGWFKSKGVVSGGDFGSSGTCYNYTMEQCAHHVDSKTLPLCDDVKKVAPTCSKTCPDESSLSYDDDKHFSASSYGLRGVDDIKADIQKYGTVTSAFTVYEDFLTYKSGVYQHSTGSALGGHAIKTIGWGTENGEDYWLCVNSWNNTWGDEGTFKIKMGDCGINR
mmetsp:Transcript_28792/g.38397  ORF Transcript_28792/g.38397 Transcript_28792/m.38397 type:complete len:409 (+) Transcript_28792:21-1247(+)